MTLAQRIIIWILGKFGFETALQCVQCGAYCENEERAIQHLRIVHGAEEDE